MKNLNYISYPYPVLGHLDDINAGWEYSISAITNEDDLTFSLEVKNDFYELAQRVASHKASYVCEVRCERTFLRECYKFYESNYTFKLSRQSVRDLITLNIFIIADENQPMYKMNNEGDENLFDKMFYDNRNFLSGIEKGDILAILPPYIIPVNLDASDYNGSPIIEFCKNEEDDIVKTNYRKDTIQVLLPSKTYSKLNVLKNNMTYLGIYHSSFIYNALTVALMNIKDCLDYRWAQTIITKIHEDDRFSKFSCGSDIRDLDKEDIPEIIQLLLDNPYEKMMDTLINIEKED